jgi:hypothetical protein
MVMITSFNARSKACEKSNGCVRRLRARQFLVVTGEAGKVPISELPIVRSNVVNADLFMRQIYV